MSYLAGLSLMVHVGGDNHSDHHPALGGSGGRMVCGVVP
jgi:Cu-Zn family superoxide dismutase